jgi:hypothetical protein
MLRVVDRVRVMRPQPIGIDVSAPLPQPTCSWHADYSNVKNYDSDVRCTMGTHLSRRLPFFADVGTRDADAYADGAPQRFCKRNHHNVESDPAHSEPGQFPIRAAQAYRVMIDQNWQPAVFQPQRQTACSLTSIMI